MGKIDETTGFLYFSFAEMEREITNMAGMARTFFDRDLAVVETVITPWLQQRRVFANAPPGSKIPWSIPRERPIRTRLSMGGYEPDQEGEHTIFATICALWQIAIPAVAGQVKRKGSAHPHFVLAGNASTVISVFDNCGGNAPCELARWRFEVGTTDSPGCHFHTQVLGDAGDVVFPKSMSIPRLPGLLFTTMDAVEFVLAEIFQDEWKQHVSKENDQIRTWSACQRARIGNVLRWQQEKISKYSGSPWTSFKSEKPHPHLLLSESGR